MEVILVDKHDKIVGTMEKMEAHKRGILHRAFSVLVFNSIGEMLLQKRSANKYHCAGLWSNACCSHPMPDESMEEAVLRRLKEELGIDLSAEFVFKFLYRAELENNLIEHELDYVFVGQFDGKPLANPQEVESWKYVNTDILKKDIAENPNVYTPWFRLIMDRFDHSISIMM